MKQLLILTASSLVALAAAPTSASACCGDIDSARPFGWSADGRLLVTRAVNSDCSGTLTAEVLAPGELEVSQTFDLYRAGRRLRDGQDPRVFDDEQHYELVDANDGVDPFVVPGSLAAGFATPVSSFCAEDLFLSARPNPEDGPETEPWEATVRITLRVRTDAGFEVIADDVVAQRFAAVDGYAHVHPAPDGRTALVRVSTDGPDFMGDYSTWIELPPGLAAPRPGCNTSALVIPDPSTPADDFLAEDGFYLEQGLRHQRDAQAATTADEARELSDYALMNFARALWSAPGDPALRAHLVAALEGVGHTDLAAEISDGLPETSTSEALVCEDGGCHVADPSAMAPAASAASCSAAHGETSALAVAFPFGIVFTGLGFAALRRRRR